MNYMHIRRLLILILAVVMVAGPTNPLAGQSAPMPAPGKIRIACLGASITQGVRLEHPEREAYPQQLGQLLGDRYQVTNYGVSSATLLRKGDLSYWNTAKYQSALQSDPDIVFIDLGGNDAKSINRVHLEDYESDYHALIRPFRQLPSHPRIILLLPLPGFGTDTTGIWDPVIVSKVIPHIRQVAYEEQLEVLDLHSLFIDKESQMPDKVHPDLEGTTTIARRLYAQLTQASDTGFDIFSRIRSLPSTGPQGIIMPQGMTVHSFYGYACADFMMNGREARIVQPKRAAAGHPWVWRARFWGHEPQTDIALLERGYHIVYEDVAELFGNRTAIARWDEFYDLLQRAGLHKKAVMEGMSRGAVYVFNWAAAHPDRVASVYVDNPVLDLKSWPGGLGKVPRAEREDSLFREDYQLHTNEEVRAFKGSPIDKIPQIVQGRYPILILCADADEAVPPEENTLLFEKKIKELNGNIRVIHKPGFHHHPHSLPDPSPIVDFILSAEAASPDARLTDAARSDATPLKTASSVSPAGTLSWLDAYDVQYNEPGPGSAQSMPIGNGDIGLNVWVEPDGSLNFYISKTDAWGDQVAPGMDPWMRQGGILSKLGKIRISFRPNPSISPGSFFRQVLRLGDGEIAIREGEGDDTIRLRIWVDANHPVIRVEAQSAQPAAVKVTLVDWRLQKGDSILMDTNNRITWFHRNRSAPKQPTKNTAFPDSALAGRMFGASIRGPGLRRKDDSTLLSVMDTRRQLISIFPLTTATGTHRDWLDRLDRQVTGIGRLGLENTRRAHKAWWNNFWSRSWINVRGDSTAWYTTRGAILQRWVTACAGRGNYPIKFNGSIFTVDNPDWRSGGHASPQDPDFRAWGGQYWFQNTRPMYWPRLMAGDFDIMLPLFRMYAAMIPGNAALVRKYYGHDGAYFQETSPFWGGIPYMGPEVKENYTAHYFTPILELSFMMLDYYEYTGDRSFAKNLLLPIATAGLRFFDSHFGRDTAGRLLLDPDNSIEMFWKVHDPAPDVAGLKAVLTRMIGLPDDLVNAAERSRWQRLLAALPELPKGTLSDLPVLLPYTGPQTAHARNLENPELYAVYPFRLYGPGRPDLELAKNTFDTRKFRDKGCWAQDPIQAAMLGYADIAKEYVAFALTRKDPRLKFPAFWDKGHDYEPDEDNGGNGENGLQKMLLQTDGRKIFLLPAWPQGWDADFKLHAPYGTIIQGKVVNGQIRGLVVTPAARAADVVDCSKNPGVIGH